MKQSRLFIILIIAALALVACSSDDEQATEAPTEAPAATAEASEGGTIVLADISGNPDKVFRRFQPVADYLAERLGDYGIETGEVRVAPDMETMIEWINAGEVDLYFDSLYPVMLVGDATGATPILRRWRDGVGEYHSVFFAQSDSGIDSVDDLTGQLVAFQDATSTSGYMMPAAHIVSADLELIEVASNEDEAPEDAVGYVFSDDDENTLQWVISGAVVAGVTDNVSFNEIPEESRENLTIFAETEPVPRQVVLARGDLDPDLLGEIARHHDGNERIRRGSRSPRHRQNDALRRISTGH